MSYEQSIYAQAALGQSTSAASARCDGTANAFSVVMRPPRLSSNTPFFVVIDSGLGSVNAQTAQREITDVLRAAGREHHVFTISHPKHLDAECRSVAQIADRHEGAVIVAGNAGTISAALNATLPTGRPFGVVPLAFDHGGRVPDLAIESAAATVALLTARVAPHQVGSVNDRAFLVNASVGLCPEVLAQSELAPACGRGALVPRRYGSRHALAACSALAALWRGRRRLVLEMRHGDEREVLNTPSLLVGNHAAGLQHSGALEPEPAQRHLAALALRPVSTPTLFWLALQGALGKHGHDENVRAFAFRRLTVRPRFGRGAIKVVLDGVTRSMRPPLVFAVSPHPLMLMTPAAASAALAA